MTQSTANPSFTNAISRCTHRYANGRRCRISAGPHPNFCSLHARLPQNLPDPAQIASTLTADLDDFTSALQINDFLSRLLLLLAQDKISTRRAAVLAYITNQIIRTLAAIAKEDDDPGKSMVITCKGDYCRDRDINFPRNSIVFDAPRPDYSKHDAAKENAAENKSASPAAPKLEVVPK